MGEPINTTAESIPYFRQSLKQELLRRQKTNRRYSLRAFARSLGIAPSHISRILRGHRLPSVSAGRKIAAQLKMPETQFTLFVSSIINEKLSQTKLTGLPTTSIGENSFAFDRKPAE